MNWSNQLSQYVGGNSAYVNSLLVILATLLVSLFCEFIVSKLKNRFDNTVTPWDDAFANSLGAPVQLLIWVVGLSIALDATLLTKDSVISKVANTLRDLGIIISITWFLIRFIRMAERNFAKKEPGSPRRFDLAAVEAIGKISRLIVFIIAFLVAMQTLGISIAGVLTFGGVGGIAVGFAAKDLLSNFFGGLMIYLDRPFTIGDWIRSPDREIEGSVERIGWRITLVRTFENRPLYVPNSAFSTVALENVSRMTHRRIYETIGIRYDDAGVMDTIVTQVREYLNSHADIDQEQTLMVNFTTFAPSSLDFFIYCFTKATSGLEFNSIKQEILLGVLNIIERNGAECAFPTTTLNLQSADIPKIARKN